MPTYIYKCDNNHREKIEHSIKENPEIICESCRGGMSRVPPQVTVSFKGSGFASNDK